MKNFEHAFSSAAIQKIPLKSLHLSYQLTRFGQQYPIYKCHLTDHRNHHGYISGGKGFGSQCKVSAVFEAAQHFFTFQSLQDDSKILFSDLKSLPNNAYFKNQQWNIAEDRVLPFLKYQSYSNPNYYIYYPLPLTEFRLPKLEKFKDFDDLNWRSHDTGSSIGCSLVEASIHGINEWIERDAYALFLIKTFLKSAPEKVRIVSKHSIPTKLRKLVSFIETTYQDELILVDTTSDIGVPSFIVTFSRQNYKIQPKGMGASLSRDYALERAIFEALQCQRLRNQNTVELESRIINAVIDKPLLLGAAIAAIGQRIREHTYQEIDFSEITDYSLLEDLSMQLEKLLELLKAHGFEPFYHEYYRAKNGLSSIGIIIPGFEEFFLIKSGKFIFPKKRGIEILEDHYA